MQAAKSSIIFRIEKKPFEKDFSENVFFEEEFFCLSIFINLALPVKKNKGLSKKPVENTNSAFKLF